MKNMPLPSRFQLDVLKRIWQKNCLTHYSETIHTVLCSCLIQNNINMMASRCMVTARGLYQVSKTDDTEKEKSAIAKVRESPYAHLTFGQKVKETTKDASYLGVIIAGIGITGIMFYTIFRELFSGHSPNSVYSDALQLCRADPLIVQKLGEPIKGYGERTSRGRRRHVSHYEYKKDGINYMRMKFYIEGSHRKGTVHLEVKENKQGKYDYRYLLVDLEGYPPDSVILQDNRSFM